MMLEKAKDLVKTDHHDLDLPELNQLVNELKDLLSSLVSEYEGELTYRRNLEYENTLLKASVISKSRQRDVT